MTISNYKRVYGENAKSIPITSIVFTEKIHLDGIEKGKKIRPVENPLCIVRKIDNERYSLVVGFADLITAINEGLSEIPAIIVPDKDRENFLNSLDNTYEILSTSSLLDPHGWTYPSSSKIKDCMNKYNSLGIFGKSIVADPTGKILDGYSAVCAARLLGIEKIPVYVIKESRWKFMIKHKKSNKST